MNGEWVFLEIARWVLSLALAYIGYFLGIRSQKIQALREYVTDIVKDKYPALFHELRFNSETLDNYLEKPNVNFNFPVLDDMYDSGLDEFVKTHHADLFSMIDSVRKNILPKFEELNVRGLMERLFDITSEHLRQTLPKLVVDRSENIALDLARTINPYYIIPDLLNDRDEEVKKKIEGCIRQRTAHVYREKAKRPYVIRGQQTAINYGKILQSLLEKAKPETQTLVNKFKELKKQYDEEVKEKLLPLLQKYISNPI